MSFSFLPKQDKISQKQKSSPPLPKFIFSLAIFIVAAVILLVSFSSASHAQSNQPITPPSAPAGNPVGGALAWLADWGLGPVVLVLYIITVFCMYYVYLAAYILDLMLNPALYNFTSNQIILYGWTIVRDICNMFFLLVLLFIAFCTILQIDKYHVKKTLLILILMALLINFSKPIAVFIFDGSQLLMTYFLKLIGSDGQSYSTKITDLSRIAGIVYESIPGAFYSQVSWFNLCITYLFSIIFLFMFGTALIILAIYLLIRIVAITVLIIVSPVAFLATAIPDFKKISSDWWDALFKYSYVGPAIAFFLLLSTKFINFLPQINASGIGSMAVFLQKIIQYLTILVFLYASIIISQKFGIAFAGAITSRAGKIMTGAAKRMGYQWTARPLARWTGVPQALGQVKEDWKRRGLPIPFGKGRRLWSPEKTERRAAGLAERMGVPGAYMAHLRKSMENYKNLSNDEIIVEAERGNAVAALSAAGRGKLSTTMLNAVHANPKNRRLFEKDGKWDMGSEYSSMMFKDSVEKGQAHVFTAFEAKNSGMTTTEAVQKRWGKLTANQLGNQNLPEAMGELDTDVSREIGAAVGRELKTFFHGLSKNVKTQLSRQAKGENAALLDSIGVFPTSTRPSAEQPRQRPPRTHADEPHDIPDFSR